MNDEILLTTTSTVEAALANPDLVPPRPPDTLRPGPTADLRQAMARFSSGDTHRTRRADVVAAIARLDLAAVQQTAERVTSDLLAADTPPTIELVATVVPTATLAECLGHGHDSTEVAADTLSVARVIGRGEPSSPESDRAASSLLSRFADRPDAVAVVSMLYQSHDATAALVTNTVDAAATGEPRRSAVASTIRSAATATTVNGEVIPAGATVRLDLADTGLEFGAGLHECPGRAVAEAILSGVLGGVQRAGSITVTR